MMRPLMLAVLVTLVLGWAFAASAGEKKVDPKKQEEMIREEALSLLTGDKVHREPVTGIFRAAPDQIASDKPLPKVVGVLVHKGNALPLMVNQKATLDYLERNAGREVTVMAKILDKGDQGKWLVADEVVKPAGGGATLIRKRGGL